ncbi:hypothetical protein ACLOJK_000722 [Asimina triloba]
MPPRVVDKTKHLSSGGEEFDQRCHLASHGAARGCIQFERSSSSSLKDIGFEKGVLSLPEIMVDDATESKFLNLMAFEHLHSKRDVILLSQSKIVKNFVGTDTGLVNWFMYVSLTVLHFTHDSNTGLVKVILPWTRLMSWFGKSDLIFDLTDEQVAL